MEFAFIIDPLASLKAYKDTSVAMMRALQARGATLFVLEPADLFWTASATRGRGKRMCADSQSPPCGTRSQRKNGDRPFSRFHGADARHAGSRNAEQLH